MKNKWNSPCCAQILRCSVAQMLSCSIAQMQVCSVAQLLRCSVAQMLSCSVAPHCSVAHPGLGRHRLVSSGQYWRRRGSLRKSSKRKNQTNEKSHTQEKKTSFQFFNHTHVRVSQLLGNLVQNMCWTLLWVLYITMLHHWYPLYFFTQSFLRASQLWIDCTTQLKEQNAADKCNSHISRLVNTCQGDCMQHTQIFQMWSMIPLVFGFARIS